MRKAGDAPAARPFLVRTDAGPGSGRSGTGTGGGLRAGGARRRMRPRRRQPKRRPSAVNVKPLMAMDSSTAASEVR